MKIISQETQLAVMEELAAQCWPVTYDQARELMFAYFNAEYGENNWIHSAIDSQKEAEFIAWLNEDET